MADTYITTVHRGKGYIARVHKPILTEEERARRIEVVKEALIEFAKERMRANG